MKLLYVFREPKPRGIGAKVQRSFGNGTLIPISKTVARANEALRYSS